jgi:hypothetical protein
MYYSGADFYNYLSGCSEDGMITFGTRDTFDEKMKKNGDEKKQPRYIEEEQTYKELRNRFPEEVDVDNLAALNTEIDELLNPK